MTSKKEIGDRRIDFYLIMSRGVPLCEAVQTIRDKYSTSKRRLYDDWAMREAWGRPEFVEPPRKNMIAQDTLFRLNELRRRLWAIVDSEEAEIKDSLKAISALIDLEFRSLSAAQSLGVVHQEPLKVDIEERAEQMHERVVELCSGNEKSRKL